MRITVLFLLFGVGSVFADTDPGYKVSDRQIFILPVKKVAAPENKNVPLLIEQPEKINLRGKVTDSKGEPIPGTNVRVKDTNIGVTTNADGNFTLDVPLDAKVLVFSFIGMKSHELPIAGKTKFDVSLQEETVGVDEVVVIGYGTQKKETLVGAITQASRTELERSGGVSNLGQAITGRLPGVTTILNTSMPGANDPQIFIRGQSSWNNSQPLILVDGIERRMNDVDYNEIENISVLKDASATAVFGVKGAEGVILINTRRGASGKTQLSFSANQSISFLARMPKKLDAYESYLYQNKSIEYKLPYNDAISWPFITPMAIAERYRKPQNPADIYAFPNVDWVDEMTRDFASTNHFNLNVKGGTNFAKYFGSLSYTHEGDILKSGLENGLGYKTEYSYDRFNFRTNLDFNITESTTLAVNLGGFVGIKHDSKAGENDIWRAFYDTPPSAFPVRYPDGAWGTTSLSSIVNPIQFLNTRGVDNTHRTQVTTDFVLKQNLDFFIPGLSAQGSLSYDNEMYSNSGTTLSVTLAKYTARDGTVSFVPPVGTNEFDFVSPSPYINGELFEAGNLAASYRRLFYQLQFNYSKKFGRHDIGATALMNREEYAMGSMFPRYREDWVGRVTYNYDTRFLFESNAAYNGSEKFGKGYRFGFFPSVAAGWVVSNEQFMKSVYWISKLKARYSIGKIGSDNFSAERWAYDTSWTIDDKTYFGWPAAVLSPYTQYKELVVGNPDLQWEEATKQNLGIDLGVFKNILMINFELFREDRGKIFMNSAARNVPGYFGAAPVAANIGKTKKMGYELELNFRKTTPSKFTYFADYSLTYAKEEVLFREDPEVFPAYMKNEGFQIGQTKTNISAGYMNTWDDVYAVVRSESGMNARLPGGIAVVDYNADGLINSFDNAPYGFPQLPQYTYNFSMGVEYKGISAMVQFYGVFNSTRSQSFSSAEGIYPVWFVDRVTNYWTPENTDARWPAPGNSGAGTMNYYDGSILRLKTVELAYTFDQKWIKKLNMSSLKVYINGNDLFFWSDLPEDRESNSGGYPKMGRLNMGLSVTF